eukprot:Colp12_sorted_trinity150504_noHs@27357
MRRAIVLVLIVAALVALLDARPIKPTTANGYFWHLTDVHINPHYKVGVPTSGNCRNESKFRLYSDTLSQRFGSYQCDIPQVLLDSAFHHMATEGPQPDFIIWTGDDPTHCGSPPSICELTKDEVIQSVTIISDLIKEFFPGVPIIPSLGNHDTDPESQLSVGDNWVLRLLSQLWSPWLDEKQLATFSKWGYYAAEPVPNLVIVALNTVYWYSSNKLTFGKDPGGQFAWLEALLEDARVAGKSVVLTGHIPPGADERNSAIQYTKEHNEQILKIISRYGDVISHQIYGHLHTDTFRLFYDTETDSEVRSSAMLSPALTPWQNQNRKFNPNNPALRKYHLGDGDIQGYTQYFFDLGQANAEGAIH